MDSVCLVERTLHLMDTRPRRITYDMITQDIGISRTWLSDFANGKIGDPSAKRIQKLYEYLSGQPLISD